MFASQLNKIGFENPVISKFYTGCFSADELNKIPINSYKNTSFILNTSPSNKPGQHWICCFIRQSTHTLIYFDPLAEPIPLNWKHWFVARFGQPEVNAVQIQNDSSIYCGLFCLFALYFFSLGYSMQQVQLKFTPNLTENDRLVTAFSLHALKFNPVHEIAPLNMNEAQNKAKVDLQLLIHHSNHFV